MKFYTVDVRDCAIAHVLSLKNDKVNNHRLILGEYNSIPYLNSIAHKHYRSMGYSVVHRLIPNFLVKMFAFVSPELKSVASVLGKKIELDTSPSTDLLGLKLRPIDETVIASCDALIYFNMIKEKRKMRYSWVPNTVFKKEEDKDKKPMLQELDRIVVKADG